MSNDRNPENRHGSKQQSDGLTATVFEELDPDDTREVIGGRFHAPGSGSCPYPGSSQVGCPQPSPLPVIPTRPGGSGGSGGGGGGGTGALTVA